MITPAGPTARRLPPKISSIAGSVWWIRKPLRRLPWFAALAGIANAQNIIDGKAAPETLGVTAVDAHTLRVQLDKPLPWFSNLTASFAFYPVQKANVDSGANWTRPGSLVGNGAYVLKRPCGQ